MISYRFFLLFIPLLLLVACDLGVQHTDTIALPAKKVSFTGDIKPLLESRCLHCHNTGTLLGHLNLETRKLAFTPGPDGPFIVPGNPKASKLYTFTLIPENNSKAMPPSKHQLSDAEKKLLFDWIAQGADWPAGPEGTLKMIAAPPAS